MKKIDKKSLVNLARESLVREKIKKIEILKNESSLTVKDEILEGIIQNYYKKLKLENLSEFKDYLARYNLKLQDIKEKLIIEIFYLMEDISYQKLWSYSLTYTQRSL